MPLFVFAVLMGIVRGVSAALKRSRAKPPQRGLCADCAFVHRQYGVTGRNTVFCTFGGGVREVKLDVLYCTDYRDRNTPPRLVQIGFAPEIRGVT
jgi:hypothetical protein